ncbi:hypothetical protein BGX27_009988 [Mortierella sp. AM989]|nr:hypothetical protein BGX27_009988 [Mortierella sp. AM989]
MLTAALPILSFTSAHIANSNPPPDKLAPGQRAPLTLSMLGLASKERSGYKKGPYHAGEIVPVRFWNFEIKNYKKFPPPKGLTQPRRGGGACEFSPSYDGSRSWKVIGQYTMSGQFRSPTTFPRVPTLTSAFSPYPGPHMPPISHGKLPQLDMAVVGVKQMRQKINVYANGDHKSTESSGPDRRKKRMSTNGYYAHGGGVGKHVIDLGLVRA